MKKTSIKVFGVCAATLLTLGAVAPVAVHAEEVTEARVMMQERAKGNTNIKTDIYMDADKVANTFNGELVAKNIYNLTENKNLVDITELGLLKEKHIGEIKKAQDDKLQFDGDIEEIFVDGNKEEPFEGFAEDTKFYISYATPKYNIGDSFDVVFYYTPNPTINPGKLEKIASTTVHVTEYGEEDGYVVKAHDLNAQVGDLYDPLKGITVNDRETGNYINNAIFLVNNGTKEAPVFGFYSDRGNFVEIKEAKVEGTTTLKGIGEINKMVKAFYGWTEDEYYIVYDNGDFAGTDNIDIIENATTGQTEFKYAKDVKDYRQNLVVFIPENQKHDNDGEPTGEVEGTLVNRLINVTGEVEGETPVETKVPVYRAYNPNNGDHLFTTSLKEYNEVVDKGWAPEGLAWNAATEEDGTKPVYRLYNPNSGEHFYTDSEKEYNEVAAAGWNKEGIAFYSAASEDGVKIFRSFNPNATGPGSHMFTDSEKEYNELTAAGWSPEGVAFYGIK